MDSLIEHLRERLRKELPGHAHFHELSGYKRPDLDAVLQQQPPPRESAVLITLFPQAGEWHTLLMLRPEYEGVHSGQIAFPGGHREAHDPDLRATALREFSEEMGATTAGFEVLGELTRVYIPPSRALVLPVIANAPHMPALVPDATEVAAAIPVPLHDLMRGDILKRGKRYVAVLQREVDVPYWEIQGHMVWGATAMMVAELRELLHGLVQSQDLQ